MNNKISRASIVLIAFAVITKISGLFRESLFAMLFGATPFADSYSISATAVNTLIDAITTAFGITFIPIYVEVTQKSTKEDADHFVSNCLNILVLLILGISAIAMVFSKELVLIFASGFDEERLELSNTIVLGALPFCCMYAVYAVASGYMQLKGKVSYIGIRNLASSLIIISFFFIGGTNAAVEGIGRGVSILLPALFGLYLMKKSGFQYYNVINFKDPYIRQVIRLAIPVIMGQLVVDVNTMIDRNFASILESGTISVLSYANHINMMFFTIVTASICTAIFPQISELVVSSTEEKDTLIRMISRVSKRIIVIAIPIMILTCLLSVPIIKIVYMRGKFSWDIVILTSKALTMYALGTVAISLSEVYSRVLYALKFNRIVLLISIFSVGINIGLNMLLIDQFGFLGLAFATMVSANLRCILFMAVLRVKETILDIKEVLIYLLRVGIAGIIMGAMVAIMKSVLIIDISTNLYKDIIFLTIIGLTALFVYLLICSAFSIQEVRRFMDRL